MDVARSAPQEAHYHTDVIYLTGNEEGGKDFMVLQYTPCPLLPGFSPPNNIGQELGWCRPNSEYH